MSKPEDFLRDLFFNLPYFLKVILINIYGYQLAKRRFGGNFKDYYEFFQKSQWWSIEKLKAFQFNRLQEILNIAYAKVPFYKSLFQAKGLTIDDFKNIDDLKKLPLITKEKIRANFKSFLHQDFLKFKKVIKHSTSGTTGEKFFFYLPFHLLYMLNYSLIYRFYSWGGVKLGDKRVTLGGRFFTNTAPFWVFNKAENQLLLSIHHLNETTVDLYVSKIRDFKPVFIQGHPSGIHFLAERVNRLKTSIPVKSVFTTGETLFDYQREEIQKAFKCEVFESYGLGESVFAAFECEEHNGLHEASELGIMEFVEAEPGLYMVIGTSLWNYVMPFIRYQVEDLVEISENEKCSCGRGLPLKIKKVIGRIDDIIISAKGTIVFPVSIRMAIKPLLFESENYQLQQVGKKEYVLLFQGVLEGGRKESFVRRLTNLLGEEATLEIKEVDKIPMSSGKKRNIVNLWINKR